MSITAMKQALKVLEANQPVNYCMNNNGEKFPMMQEDPFRFERNTKTITALRQAIQQAEEAQPVAVYRAGQAPGEVYHVQFFKEMNADEVLLYTAPLPRKPLTEDQIAECANSVKWSNAYHFAFARAIEAAHGIKEEA
jgi:hypothetical protein